MRSATFPRIIGGLTTAYGLYTLARPHSLARAAGVEPGDRDALRHHRNLGWAIGGRDLVSGAAMVLATPGKSLRAAITARVACDLGDAVGFGLWASPRSRAKVIAVATGWGLLCAAAFAAAGPTR